MKKMDDDKFSLPPNPLAAELSPHKVVHTASSSTGKSGAEEGGTARARKTKIPTSLLKLEQEVNCFGLRLVFTMV